MPATMAMWPKTRNWATDTLIAVVSATSTVLFWGACPHARAAHGMVTACSALTIKALARNTAHFFHKAIVWGQGGPWFTGLFLKKRSETIF